MRIQLRASYNIYCEQNFIGFCIIHNNGYDIQANLILIESIQTGSHNQIPSGHKNYALNTSDIDIIKDLMSNAVPSFQTDRLNYTAKKHGEIYKLKR